MFLDKRFDAKDLSSTSDGVGGAERLLETRRMTDAPPFLSFSRAMYHHQQSTSSNAFSFTIEAAHKKGTGSVKNGRDSNPKYRGVKLYGQEKCRAGNIIVRQLGNKFHAGPGVGTGKDFTLYALRDGEILFKNGAGKKKYVCVVDAVDRSADVSRKTKRRELCTPRASAAVESR